LRLASAAAGWGAFASLLSDMVDYLPLPVPVDRLAAGKSRSFASYCFCLVPGNQVMSRRGHSSLPCGFRVVFRPVAGPMAWLKPVSDAIGGGFRVHSSHRRLNSAAYTQPLGLQGGPLARCGYFGALVALGRVRVMRLGVRHNPRRLSDAVVFTARLLSLRSTCAAPRGAAASLEHDLPRGRCRSQGGS